MTTHQHPDGSSPPERATNRVHLGWASVDLTPDGLVPMRYGEQSAGVLDPITASVLVVASGDTSFALVSCDLLWIADGRRTEVDLLGAVRERVAAAVPDGPGRVVLSATHTHASLTGNFEGGLLHVVAERIAGAVVEAWESRTPGAISFGLGHAVAGHHRIVTHADGSARMVGTFQGGSVDHPDFRHLQGFEDHSVHLLYTWDDTDALTGVVVNVACPSQVQRGDLLSADFWHEAREELADRLGPEVHVLPQLSAAGDLGTHVMVERGGEERMARLMYGALPDPRARRRKQIATRIADAVTTVLPWMADVAETHPVVAWESAEVSLPGGFPDPDPDAPPYPVEVNALRIGDVAMVTNPFELYLDHGVRIKGRSPGVQTFVVQLAGSGSYLPTERAIPGGSYGAIPRTCKVGPTAGHVLVEASIDLLEGLWA